MTPSHRPITASHRNAPCRSGGNREQGRAETGMGDEDGRRVRAFRRSYKPPHAL
jgi:hypothetical protein